MVRECAWWAEDALGRTVTEGSGQVMYCRKKAVAWWVPSAPEKTPCVRGCCADHAPGVRAPAGLTGPLTRPELTVLEVQQS
jgi:hypothetical protein